MMAIGSEKEDSIGVGLKSNSTEEVGTNGGGVGNAASNTSRIPLKMATVRHLKQ